MIGQRKGEPSSAGALETQVALPGEAEPDLALLDQAVRDINRIYVQKGLEMVLALGQYVLDTFFGGQADTFRTRGNHHVTFRRLSERDDLQVGYATLWRAVSVLDQLALLPEPVARSLPPTHHVALLPLKDPRKKVELARRAVDRGWSRDELERAVRAAKGSAKGGRPSLPRFVKTLHQWSGLLEDTDEAFGDLDAVERLDEDEARRLVKTVSDMRLKCDELERALRRRVGGGA